jgi:hypothetical protein
MRSHEWIDQRSLAMDRMLAEKLERDPALIQRAVNILEKWIAQRLPTPAPVMLEWRSVLSERSPYEVIRLLQADDPEARRLRQSSPFCGLLSPQERWAILRTYETRRT